MKGINLGQDGDGSGNGMFGQEAHDGNHGQASIVEFAILLGSHDIRRNTAAVHLGPNQFGRGSAHHVVRFLQFGKGFGQENGANNLPLA